MVLQLFLLWLNIINYLTMARSGPKHVYGKFSHIYSITDIGRSERIIATYS